MKQNKIKIAITGGIGSGKSAVSKIIKDAGYPVFSCDEIVRDIFKVPTVIEKLSEVFPDCVLSGIPDRKKIADVVFSNEKKLKELENITHPEIMRILNGQMDDANSKLVFAEVPLLFEGGFENDFDKVIIVLRNKSERIKATCERDGISEHQVLQRMEKQFDYENKKIFEHTVIYNDETLEKLREKVGSVLEKFKTV